MKRKASLLCLILLLCACWAAWAEEAITLKPGQEEFRKLESIKRISVADPFVVDAKVLSGGQQMMIRAVNPGETTVTVFDDQEKMIVFRITVVSTLSEEAQKIKQLLTGVETVNVRVIDNQIVIEGAVIRDKDRKPLIKVKELYKDIKFLVEDNVDKNQEYIISGIGSELPSTLEPKMLGDGVMLEGTVASKAEKDDAERIAKEYVENVYGDVIKVQEVKAVATVRPLEFNIPESAVESATPEVKTLEEGLKIEKGLFAFVLEDDMAADNLVQGVFNNLSGTSAFDGTKDFTQNGQYELSASGGERLYVFFQFDVIQKDLFKVSVSILDGQKKVLTRNDFYAKKAETIAVSGFYNILRSRNLMDEKTKELVLVFNSKS
jgi:hypothetical protein